jgi:hypothetical protein
MTIRETAEQCAVILALPFVLALLAFALVVLSVFRACEKLTGKESK